MTPDNQPFSTKGTATDFQQETVLIIDSCFENIEIVKKTLEAVDFTVLAAPDQLRGMELMYEAKPQMILIDESFVEGKKGKKFLAYVKGHLESHHGFLIILSGGVNAESFAHALQQNVHDLMEKPLSPLLLKELIQNRFRYKRRIDKAVLVDELTGTFNRTYMSTKLREMIAWNKRTEDPGSIAILDLDHFKKVNDQYGHATGDQVLKTFADIMRQKTRESDIVCRYGGEEFVVLLPNTRPEDAEKVIERVRQTVEDTPFHSGEDTFHVTFSTGITFISSEDGDPDQLVHQADQALYQAKHYGRNRIFQFDNTMSTHSQFETSVNLMIVEDAELIRKMIKDYFMKYKNDFPWTLNIHMYRDGDDFLKADWYKDGEKYLILLDAIMPGKDGFETLKVIRRNYPADSIVVSMLTGLTDGNYVIEALKLGADDYLLKPLDMREVSKRTGRLIERLLKV